ncbi:Crp/Fnr family transcriptional regulator [Litorimonas haliclonae]|uniref:Crp/Fnr family transcriptional regulator n=1 Tax=Litorimonas haliclonae TaxID=2081977 RepID=UPI0039EED57C
MNPLIKRVAHYADVGPKHFEGLINLPHKIEVRKAGQEIVSEGDVVDFVFIIQSGWAIRFDLLDDGRRQILNFMLPGDCFDMMSLTNAKSDHNVSAATDLTLRRLKASDFLTAIKQEPALATAFWWVAVQEESILREQIIRVGRRSAKERVGHLILELNRRMAATTGKLENFLYLPVPQSLLADALGLSVVHISRTLTKLKADQLISTDHNGIQILDRPRLEKISNFDSQYLHLEKLTF